MNKAFRKHLSKDDVRMMCINHDYYTAGDNEEYDNMFHILDWMSPEDYYSNISIERLEMMAEDIKKHSVTADTVEEIMENLAFYIKTEIVYLDC